MTWGWRWNEQCSANKSTNAASNYVSRLNKKIAHFEQKPDRLAQSAWSLSNRTGITVSLALLPPFVDRYGVPVFIGTYEDEHTFGSARGIPEFHVFEALNFCKDLLENRLKAAGAFQSQR